LVENGIPPSPFIRQLLYRAPIRRGCEKEKEEGVVEEKEVVASLFKRIN
jgi:hypothetical protein